ncbi:hypothetical protein ABK040_014573 [Willaertia magna]
MSNQSLLQDKRIVYAILATIALIGIFILFQNTSTINPKSSSSTSSNTLIRTDNEPNPDKLESYIDPTRNQQASSAVSCPPCKCLSVTENPPDTGDGQITMQTSFGKALYNLARQENVRKVLEIGTWFGGGSTQCIAKGLQETGNDKLLYTIEMYEPAWQYARSKYSHLPIRFILGGTVPSDKYLKPEEVPENEKNTHYRLYYQRDIELAKSAEPWLKPLCLAHKFDAVLIDGNEYTGWGEFEVVDSLCKPKYLMLHDVGTLKTSKIERYLKENKDTTIWTLKSEGADAARWQIYERKDL